MSRRALLRGAFLRVIGTEDSAGPDAPRPASVGENAKILGPARARHARAFPILRPPGAIEESAFLEGCTRCDACVQACPHSAIRNAPVRFRAAAGTPMIDPSPAGAPCRMCDDLPCIDACEPNVLSRAVPVRMGRATIDPHACLAHIGSFCSVCSEQCPVEEAIEIRSGRPMIVQDRCTGCGVCQHVCPAPENAILLLPERDRPPLPAVIEQSEHEENA